MPRLTVVKDLGWPIPRLRRAPFEARESRELQRMQKHHLRPVIWNIDSQDWQKGMQKVPGRIARRTLVSMLLKGRGIVLMHDMYPTSARELGWMFDRCQSKL